MIPLSIRFNHALAHGKLQKIAFKNGKDVVDVSHTVNSVFSIVKRRQRGAAADLTMPMSIQDCYAEQTVGT